MERTLMALTWPGLILPLGDTAGQLLLVVLLLGSHPLHPDRQRLLWNLLPQTPLGTPPSSSPTLGCPNVLVAAGTQVRPQTHSLPLQLGQ